MMMYRIVPVFTLALALAGCANMPGAGSTSSGSGTSSAPTTSPLPPAKPVSVQALGNRGYAARDLDRTTAEEKKAALSVKAGGGERALGKSVVALGPPVEPGLWVQSPLIKAKGQGRIATADGKSLGLELRPGSGGALLSFSAYQTLGIPLTSLPEVTIYAN